MRCLPYDPFHRKSLNGFALQKVNARLVLYVDDVTHKYPYYESNVRQEHHRRDLVQSSATRMFPGRTYTGRRPFCARLRGVHPKHKTSVRVPLSTDKAQTHKEIHLTPHHRRRSALGTHMLVTDNNLHTATYHKLRRDISSCFTRRSRKIRYRMHRGPCVTCSALTKRWSTSWNVSKSSSSRDCPTAVHAFGTFRAHQLRKL